jgi:hypothetical protein
MLNYLDKFLDKLEWWSMKVLIGLGLILTIVFVVGVLYVLGEKAKDNIIGYTDHGVIIRESDLEVEDE